MSHLNASVSTLVTEHLDLLQDLEIQTSVLDLACGFGRNGLFLVTHQIPVTFADKNSAALLQIEAALQTQAGSGQTWQVDFEVAAEKPLAARQFDAILVFNYLHRPLLGAIKQAVRPGGLIFYETFTVDQGAYGKPSNPDFLLRKGELRDSFQDWQVLHDFEGDKTDPQRAVANLIARRP